MQTFDLQMLTARLKRLKVHVTKSRLAILMMLYQHHSGISVARIRQSSSESLNRVSIYRTLQLFLKKGIVLTVPNSQGDPQYILTDFFKTHDLVSGSKFAYFVCKSCGYTELIEQPLALDLRTPAKHLVKRYYILLEGLCKNCKNVKAFGYSPPK